jgi:hypothetical protein
VHLCQVIKIKATRFIYQLLEASISTLSFRIRYYNEIVPLNLFLLQLRSGLMRRIVLLSTSATNEMFQIEVISFNLNQPVVKLADKSTPLVESLRLLLTLAVYNE